MKRTEFKLEPESLEFYLGAPHTHKQLLTLHNRSRIPVDFQVFCTSSHKFTVVEPKGAIAAGRNVDIVVRYTQGDSAPPGSEQFLIKMLERTTHQTLDKGVVTARILEGEPANARTDSRTGDFLPLTAKSQSKTEERERSPVCTHPAHRYSQREPQPVNVVAVMVSLCCIVALLLPTQPERPTESQLPAYMHISVNLKLVFSFVLGLVAMMVLRP